MRRRPARRRREQPEVGDESMSGTEDLVLEDVSRQYDMQGGGVHCALSRLNLRVSPGEFVALLGPSGCGKTTALNCIAGLTDISAGSIHVAGRRIDRLTPDKRNVGVVFQNYALFPHMSILDNVAFGLRMRGMPRAQRHAKAMEAIRLVQLEQHAHKHPAQLSGGQQQRVAIARAIVVEPDIVLMDEPLSNLDAKLRIEMRSEIRRLHERVRRITIYVTHDQDEALSMADKIVVLQNGVAHQIGTPQELFSLPRDLDVARFMGYRTLLRGSVRPADGEDRIEVEVGPGCTLLARRVGAGLEGRAVVAIRPDEIRLADGESHNVLGGEVRSAEYYGRESLVVLDTPAGTLYARLPGRFTIGSRLRVHVPAERALGYPELAS